MKNNQKPLKGNCPGMIDGMTGLFEDTAGVFEIACAKIKTRKSFYRQGLKHPAGYARKENDFFSTRIKNSNQPQV